MFFNHATFLIFYHLIIKSQNIKNMKRFLIIVTLSLILLTNCSVSDNNDENQIIKTYWHLRNVSGGLAGVNINFDFNKIVWSFDEETHIITVNNTNTDDVEDGLDTGNYPYSILNVGSDSFLIINSNEFGGLTVSQTQLIIDQNSTSTGGGADGFIYTFARVTVVENAD